MEILKFAIIVAMLLPIFICAGKEKKGYLYIFFALYGILPDACGIEISSSLPIITVDRILILILFSMVVYKKRFILKISLPKEFYVYIFLNIIVSIVNIRFGASEFNQLFIYLYEQLLVVILLYNCIDDSIEFEKCIDYLIAGGIVLAIMAVMQFLFRFDLSSALMWSDPRAFVRIEDRMGRMRACATFNALSYGCYSAFLSIVIIYRYLKTKKKKFVLALCVDLLALMCTLSRSAILSLGIVLFVMLLTTKGRMLKGFYKYFLLAIGVIAILVIVVPSVFDVFKQVFLSIMNTLGGNHKLSSEFGTNATNGTYSRLRQWSSVIFMINDNNLLFGYGYNGFVNGAVKYFNFRENYWHIAKELDVGFVAFLINGGIIGLISYFIFLVTPYFKIKKYNSRKEWNFGCMYIYMAMLLILLEFMTSFGVRHFEWLVFSLIWIWIGIAKKGKKDESMEKNIKNI